MYAYTEFSLAYAKCIHRGGPAHRNTTPARQTANETYLLGFPELSRRSGCSHHSSNLFYALLWGKSRTTAHLLVKLHRPFTEDGTWQSKSALTDRIVCFVTNPGLRCRTSLQTQCAAQNEEFALRLCTNCYLKSRKIRESSSAAYRVNSCFRSGPHSSRLTKLPPTPL